MIYLILAALLLAGCTIAGPVGEYDGDFSCQGKGSIQGTGHINLGAGVGGGQGNGFSVMVDCGDGLKIERNRKRYENPPK